MSSEDPFDDGTSNPRGASRGTSNPGGSNPGGSLNPYSSSYEHAARPSDASIGLADITARGMVGQVPILGVLMIVQGVVVCLMGIAIGVYVVFMPQLLQMQQQAAGQGGNGPQLPPNMGLWFGVIGAIYFLVVFAVGALTVFAGVRTMKFQNRVFSIVMMIAGLLTILTCYCLPTQLALSVYGLIVLLNAPVREAFWFAKQGHSARDIQRAFLSLP